MGSIKAKIRGILYPPGVTVLDAKMATALFLILFSTQLTLTSPFSYLPAMVHSFGYKDRDRGYYAGMIASSLFIGRFFGGYFWGWLTDKIGRRPVLLISASLTYAATIAFGFTTTFYWAVCTRFLQGLFNGVIVCGRAAFAEICDETNQTIGVSLVFAAWNSAIVIGPALGGFLAEPVKKYPSAFTVVSASFFTKFAYLLPSILIASILLFAILLVYFTFEETQKERYDASQPTEKTKLIPNDNEEETFHVISDTQYVIKSDEAAGSQDEDKPGNSKGESDKDSKVKRCCGEIKSWSIIGLLSDKVLMLVIIMFGISGFCIIGFSELGSLWMATNIKYGGLTFSTDKIGIALLIPALGAVVLQPILFSRLERRLGGIWTLRITLVVLAVCTIFFPFLHYSQDNKALLWFLLIIFGVFRMISDISSRSCIALFVNNAVYVDKAGRANGLAFSVQEIMRVASPTLFGSLFAWSINDEKHDIKFPLDFRLPFFIIGLFILLIFALSFLLPERINGSKAMSEKLQNGEEK